MRLTVTMLKHYWPGRPVRNPPLRDEAESTEMGKSHSHGWRVGSRALAATLVVLFSDRIIISCLVCTR